MIKIVSQEDFDEYKKEVDKKIEDFKSNIREEVNTIVAKAQEDFASVLDERIKMLIEGAKIAIQSTIKETLSSNRGNPSEPAVYIDLFMSNVTFFDENTRHHPHKYMAQFSSAFIKEIFSITTRLMLFRMCIRIKSSRWDEKIQEVTSFTDTEKLFLEVFWDSAAQQEAINYFTMVAANGENSISDYIELASVWYDTLSKTHLKEELAIDLIYMQLLPEHIRQKIKGEGLVNIKVFMNALEFLRRSESIAYRYNL